jgi:hypothetical protein
LKIETSSGITVGHFFRFMCPEQVTGAAELFSGNTKLIQYRTTFDTQLPS